ncbi:MAG TPA: xanthine dehydrogenase family protein subunit M [Candidatus Lustribacter sp.]|nr:xanthine dehydrogenase family protein subunit M [Candidatus Lustribacter sp.]
MRTYDYSAPASIDEALAALKEYGDDAEFIAGGTSLILMMQQGLVQPGKVIGLGNIKELRGIKRSADGGLEVGAMTTHRQLETSPEAFAYAAALPQSLGVIATIRIRNQATLGGNLVHADPAQDPPPVLIALDATIDVVKAGGGARSIAMESFFTDYFETTIGEDELLRSVKVPPMPAGSRLAYKKFLPRTEDDYATVSVAVRLGVNPDGTCKDIRIGLGALAVTPLRGKAVEKALLGQKLTPESIREAAALVRDEVDPLDDVRGSAGYKREMARVWTERTIASLAGVELKAKA